jgi:hypothetical protein
MKACLSFFYFDIFNMAKFTKFSYEWSSLQQHQPIFFFKLMYFFMMMMI